MPITAYVNGVPSVITVANGLIESLLPTSQKPTLWALPALVNMHTHSAMTLLRSAGSGLPLFQWLNDAIFPREAQLTPDDIYHGALDAFSEMRKCGTTAFNDMYFCIQSTLRAASEMGMAGTVSLSVTDQDFDNGTVADFIKSFKPLDSHRLSIAIAPHAIYTVSGPHLQYLADFAKEHHLPFHMHLSETRKEREDCIRQHGIPPVLYLHRLGIFDKVGSRFIGAHALWLDSDEIALLGAYNATVVHNPNSNLKLGSGCRFLYTELRDAGVNVTLGTDGCASSDNLDMIEAMKIMSLLQKGTRNDPSVLPTDEVFQVASANGRKALCLPDNSIAPGNPSDFMLIDTTKQVFNGVDFHNSTAAQIHQQLLNRLIYAAHPDVVFKTVTP